MDIHYKDEEGALIGVQNWRPTIPLEQWEHELDLKEGAPLYCSAVDNSDREVNVSAVVIDHYFASASGGKTATVSLDPWSAGSLSNASTVLYLIEGSGSDITIYWMDAAQVQHSVSNYNLGANGNRWELSLSPAPGNVLSLDVSDFSGETIAVAMVLDGQVILRTEGSDGWFYTTLAPD